MKLLFILCFSLTCFYGYAQTDAVQRKQHLKDSLTIVLQSKLNAGKETVQAVLTTIDASISKMNDNAKRRDISEADKINRFKQIAQERDKQLQALLSAEQMEKLKTIFSAMRGKGKRTIVKGGN